MTATIVFIFRISDGMGSHSDAAIQLEVDSSVFAGNGFRPGFSDFDGVRIDEGGNGDLPARVHTSRFIDDVNATGVEVVQAQ